MSSRRTSGQLGAASEAPATGAAGPRTGASGLAPDVSGSGDRLRALALVNLAAIERNVALIKGRLSAETCVCAVVKADGYGHGALRAAQAALAGGAQWLAVAGAAEAKQLREGGIGLREGGIGLREGGIGLREGGIGLREGGIGRRGAAQAPGGQDGIAEVPILVMGALSDSELRQALEANADVVVWHERQVAALARAGGGRVHVKLDTGMGRLGTRDMDEAMRVLQAAADTQGVRPVGVMTHFATADDPDDDGFFEGQQRRFADFAKQAKARWPQLIAHAANSAATLREPASHFDMVRCGIAIYGLDPFGADPLAQGLEPALQLRSYVAEVKHARAGESAGYGRRFVAQRDCELAVLPIGYGDGWRRALSGKSIVLIDGRRRPLVGTVSMDNMTVLLDQDKDLLGAEAVLIGRQGQERITAEEIARQLGSINYEVTCGLTARVPRVYHRDDR